MRRIETIVKIPGVSALVVLLMSGLMAPTAYAFSSFGDGTAEHPFRVGDCDQLQEMADNLSADYVLIRDIDCGGRTDFTPIGNGSTPFTGNVNGRGYTIHNLDITIEDSDIGLFGALLNASISNMGLVNVNVTGDGFVGALAGDAALSTIGNVQVANLTVFSASNRVGGIVGELGGSSLSGSSAVGVTVTGGNNVGGMVGRTDGPAAITDSYAQANVTGASNVGGLVGQLGAGPFIVNDTYARSIVTGTSATTGGFVGLFNPLSGAIFSNSFSVSDVTASTSNPSSTGGLIGQVVGGSNTSNLFFDEDASGESTCVGSGSADCTAVNNTGSDSAHFVDTTSVAPLNGWNFSDTWQQVGMNFPRLYPLSNWADSDDLPNSGDANGDSNPDQFQTNVISVPDFLDTWTTIEIPDNVGCTLDDPGWANPVATDTGYNRQLTTMTAFNIYCNAPGATATVTLIYDKAYDTSGWILRIYNATTEKYMTVPGAAFGTRDVGGDTKTTVTYSITDGSSLDGDSTANGIIVDPVAPAVGTQAPNTGLGQSSDGSVPLVMASVGLALLVVQRRSTPKRSR